MSREKYQRYYGEPNVASQQYAHSTSRPWRVEEEQLLLRLWPSPTEKDYEWRRSRKAAIAATLGRTIVACHKRVRDANRRQS